MVSGKVTGVVRKRIRVYISEYKFLQMIQFSKRIARGSAWRLMVVSMLCIAVEAQAQKKIVAQVCAVPMFETLLVFARHDDLDYGYKLEGSLSLGPLITEATHFK